MKIPKHVLNCSWAGQHYDILIFCEHLILRLFLILSQFQHSVQGSRKKTFDTFQGNQTLKPNSKHLPVFKIKRFLVAIHAEL